MRKVMIVFFGEKVYLPSVGGFSKGSNFDLMKRFSSLKENFSSEIVLRSGFLLRDLYSSSLEKALGNTIILSDFIVPYRRDRIYQEFGEETIVFDMIPGMKYEMNSFLKEFVTTHLHYVIEDFDFILSDVGPIVFPVNLKEKISFRNYLSDTDKEMFLRRLISRRESFVFYLEI